eukprot:TRINITY_DN960_c0_g2_i1.p1 TRINITY_DN960_c0_g2~~TRINITY_DN960_c0_g2_i1.p1  ORF type:complete len:648 (+),score=54.70 TRINITY_DN960_c0_g2_i1:68-2011(+)
MKGHKMSALLTIICYLWAHSLFNGSLVLGCSPSSCGDLRNISYPFRLKDDPANCGDPKYELSCEGNKTILYIHAGKYYVKEISYENQTIRVADMGLCNKSCNLPYKSLPPDEINGDHRYYEGHGTKVYYGYRTSKTLMVRTYEHLRWSSFVDCSRTIADPKYTPTPCPGRSSKGHVYVIYDGYKVSMLKTSCRFLKMVPALHQEVNNNSFDAIQKILESGFLLSWSFKCRDCRSQKKKCELSSELIYVGCWIGFSPSMILIGIESILTQLSILLEGRLLIGRFIFAPICIIAFLVYKFKNTCLMIDSIEKFLRNQQTLTPTRYSYTDIIGITSHFKEKLGQGGFGSVFKGKLPGGFLIAVKMLDDSKFNGEDFINEVSTIGRIHHVNVVQLIGFCSEGTKRALVYEYMPNGSLDKYIFSANGRSHPFNWEKLHQIVLGIARGIEYLHRGCDMCILHFDIKPHNILLDHNFTPKVSDFGLAKLYPKDYNVVSVSTVRGTIGYIAPELISRNFGAVSYKSDVYSFGMLLLEMAGGRRNVDARAAKSSQIYFPSWVFDRLQRGLDVEVENMTGHEDEIARKLCLVGLWCIQMKPSNRPSMSKVIEMLEGGTNDLQMPPKPFLCSSPQQISAIDECSISNPTNLSVISESE